MLGKLLSRLAGGLQPNKGTAPSHGLPQAACVLLLEVAMADDILLDGEVGHILSAMEQLFGLNEAESHEVLEEATLLRAQSTDLWQFARVMVSECPPADRQALLEAMWRIIYADGALHAHEDHLAHRINDLLRLNHRQFISAKLKVRRELGLAAPSAG